MIRCCFYAPEESASVTKPLGQSFSRSQERKTNQSILLHLLLPDFCLDGQKGLWVDSWNSGGERSRTWQPGTCAYPYDGCSMWKFKVSDCGPAKPSWALSPRGHPDRLAGACCPPPVPRSTPAAWRGLAQGEEELIREPAGRWHRPCPHRRPGRKWAELRKGTFSSKEFGDFHYYRE